MGEMTENGTRDGATANPNELKKEKKKLEKKEREKKEIEKKEQEEEKCSRNHQELDKEKKKQRKGKEDKLRSSPCGNLFCEEDAMHRCNKCKEIAFCSQECFEKSSHPKRCSGRNEQNISEVD